VQDGPAAATPPLVTPAHGKSLALAAQQQVRESTKGPCMEMLIQHCVTSASKCWGQQCSSGQQLHSCSVMHLLQSQQDPAGPAVMSTSSMLWPSKPATQGKITLDCCLQLSATPMCCCLLSAVCRVLQLAQKDHQTRLPHSGPTPATAQHTMAPAPVSLL
jgi:hypothetical protein